MTMTQTSADLTLGTHKLDKYLLRQERVVVVVRRHWVAVWEPIILAIGTIIAVVYISASAKDFQPVIGQISKSTGTADIRTMLAWLLLVVVVRSAYKLWEWRREYIIVTDRRIMLIYGVVTRRVAMLPLAKVTDMTYHRTIMGHLMGYGTFVLESAGQVQALSTIKYVANPDRTYRAVIAQIFHKATDGDDVETVSDDDDLFREHEPGGSPFGRPRWLPPMPRWGKRRDTSMNSGYESPHGLRHRPVEKKAPAENTPPRANRSLFSRDTRDDDPTLYSSDEADDVKNDPTRW
jgi:PH (Pleckstrin Homology) domain-containing protein